MTGVKPLGGKERTVETVASDLTDALNGLSTRLDDAKTESADRDAKLEASDEKLQRYGRWNRFLVAADLLTTAVAVVAIFIAGHANTRSAHADARSQAARAYAAAVHQSNIVACKIGNQGRAQQVQFWDHVAAISKPPPGETPAQRAQRKATLRKFLAYVDRSFAPRNCAALYHLQGTPPASSDTALTQTAR